jgi:hypothetical protein
MLGCASAGKRNATSGTEIAVAPSVAEDLSPETAPAPAVAPQKLKMTKILLRVVQILDGEPTHPRHGLHLWLADVDRRKPLHVNESNSLAGDLASQGWIAWNLPSAEYHLVVSAYKKGGLPSKPLFDRYRFSVRDSDRALYLGSLTYECERKALLEALCPEGAEPVNDIEAARSIAEQIGVSGADALPLRRVRPPGPRQTGTHPDAIPRLNPRHTLVAAVDSEVGRRVYNFLAQASMQKGSMAWSMGDAAVEQISELGPLAVITLPVTLIGGGIAEGIHQRRLKNKAECLRQIWDKRAEDVARSTLAEAVQKIKARPRFTHLLVLNAHRLAMQSCHPVSEWAPDPRGKRFCLEASIRAMVIAADNGEPISDEIFTLVPEDRIGPDFEPTGWSRPPAFLYETRLQQVETIKRTYRQYCDEGGSDLLERDVRDLFNAMVPEILENYGISPPV